MSRVMPYHKGSSALDRMTRAERQAEARRQQRATRQQLRRQGIIPVSTQPVVLQVPRTQRPFKDENKYVDGYYDWTNLTELSSNDQTWAGAEANPRQQTAVYGCLPIPRQGDNHG